MSFKYFKDESKLDWGTDDKDNNKILSMEQIQLGCLLRIADSLEKMEQPYIDFLQDIEYYKEFEIENKKLKRTIAGLKGYLNKTKKELKVYKSY